MTSTTHTRAMQWLLHIAAITLSAIAVARPNATWIATAAWIASGLSHRTGSGSGPFPATPTAQLVARAIESHYRLPVVGGGPASAVAGSTAAGKTSSSSN
jgi:hypothetical protein